MWEAKTPASTSPQKEPHSYLTGAELLSAPMVRLVQFSDAGRKGSMSAPGGVTHRSNTTPHALHFQR